MIKQGGWQDYEFGITCIDTALFRPGLACCYLIQDGDEAAFIDTGTRKSVPILLDVLDAKGLTRDQISWVMPTHVHLDHAGGAGALMQLFPNAKLLVHERGVAHMIAPQKLQAGSLAVYGHERYQAAFGDLIPVDEHRVVVAREGDLINVGSRILRIIDTPGHARHHYVVWDLASRGLFCGDSFGVSYPELNDGLNRFIFPPTTPVQFDPYAWHSTLDRLAKFNAQAVYLTHFGKHDRVEELAIALHQQIDEYVSMANRWARQSEPEPTMLARLLMSHSQRELTTHGCTMPPAEIQRVLLGDMDLNAQGLAHWLQRKSI